LRYYLKKPFTKIGLVEWLRVKALNSSPSTANKQNQHKKRAGRVAQAVEHYLTSIRPEFKPQYHRPPKKEKKWRCERERKEHGRHPGRYLFFKISFVCVWQEKLM
jgi:hypothetical protein